MSTQADLAKLAKALEYADLAAGLYLAGGSDHAAQLLAAGAEQVLGDLARMLGPATHNDGVQALLATIAKRYKPPPIERQSMNPKRHEHMPLAGLAQADESATDEVRQATAAYLRAAWYTLDAMGLEAVAPLRLRRAVEQSTIYADND
jgi:hypothetical protein